MFYLLFVTNEEIAEILLDFYVMEKYFFFCFARLSLQTQSEMTEWLSGFSGAGNFQDLFPLSKSIWTKRHSLYDLPNTTKKWIINWKKYY